MNIIPVILCGGSGTRLWPLSRKSLPKQFVPLIGGKSLLLATIERVSGLSRRLMVVGSDEHRFFIQDALHQTQVTGSIILEPVGRNTAAAMAVAALSAEPDELLLFCPADHHIPDAAAFCASVQKGVDAANSGSIVTFGIQPSFPSSAYGYIQIGGVEEPVADVERFIEKPSAERAEALLMHGQHYWNAGIFLAKAKDFLAALDRHAADILYVCRMSMKAAKVDGHFVRPDAEVFSSCRSESIDYAVMEHHDKVQMVVFSGLWSDVGSWKSVSELYDQDQEGNRVDGQGYVLASRDTFIHANHRPVVAVGTRNILIVDTPDALLVADADHSEHVKTAVGLLESRSVAQAIAHRRVLRPWGSYDSVDHGDRFQVKRITVNPGAKLSLQMHYHRAEHWIVVKGVARVTCGDKIFELQENQSTFIPLGEKHRLENPGKEPLEIIEVQSGSYLGEDDIVRFEDTYGRT
jgi:mannose-1-phosphate guanylyltransferase/mannose-6-phosphate isomerase